jgi:hypothetical protein
MQCWGTALEEASSFTAQPSVNASSSARGRTALVTTAGFRDAEIARANRPDMYNFRYHAEAVGAALPAL